MRKIHKYLVPLMILALFTVAVKPTFAGLENHIDRICERYRVRRGTLGYICRLVEENQDLKQQLAEAEKDQLEPPFYVFYNGEVQEADFTTEPIEVGDGNYEWFTVNWLCRDGRAKLMVEYKASSLPWLGYETISVDDCRLGGRRTYSATYGDKFRIRVEEAEPNTKLTVISQFLPDASLR